MKIFMMAASTRKESLNKKNIQVASQVMKELGSEVDLQEYETFNAPLYDGDYEAKSGVPEAIQKLSEKLMSADAFVFSVPEYNGSIPGTFKNTIDWLSRLKPHAFVAKPVLLLGASPGGLGAIRGNLHTRVPLQTLGCHLYPEYLGLSKAHEAFAPDGSYKDSEQLKKLKKILIDFKSFAEKLKS